MITFLAGLAIGAWFSPTIKTLFVAAKDAIVKLLPSKKQ
jgi:hypothetical protein